MCFEGFILFLMFDNIMWKFFEGLGDNWVRGNGEEMVWGV